MEYRTLGASGIHVSEVGFGGWAVGGDAWGPVDDRDSTAAISRAIELGVTFIDTADVYGDGRSERLVAKAIRGRRHEIVLSTKGGLMGHHRDPGREPVYDQPEKVVNALEASLQRLETDHVDVYWCHLWWDQQQETEAFLTAFERLKREGKARAVGVSTDNIDHLRHYDQNGKIDAVQVDYSILNREREADILSYAEARNLGVVVRGPLAKGLLTGKFATDTIFSAGDIRETWTNDPSYLAKLAKVDRLRVLANDSQTLGQLAIRFVLSHPAVSVAIPGAKTRAQAEENALASHRPLLSVDELSLVDKVAPARRTKRAC